MHPKSVLLLAGGAAAAAAAALHLWRRARRFELFLAEEAEAVRGAALSGAPENPLSVTELTALGLPEPVRRFLLRSADVRGGLPRLWVARGSGVMRFDSSGAWMRLDSTTVGAVSVPAFCYTGTLQLGLGRLLWCRGREALRRGAGAMQWRLWGALPLARSEGGHLDQSALLRWLAEAVCFPPALQPSRHLVWLPDEADPQRSAVARLTLGATSVTATVSFDGEGRFLELRSDDYWRVTPDGRVARNPWVARGGVHRRFRLQGGGSVEVPTQLSAAWVEDGVTEFEHIRFTVTDVAAEE